MARLLIFAVAAFVLAGCATGPTCGRAFCTAQENAAARAAQPIRPTRTIEGMTVEQVRDQLVMRCANAGFAVASTDPSHVICEKDAGVLASALLQTGVGPPPRLQFHAVTAQLSNGVQVTAWEQLQTYTWTGAPGMSESGMNSTQRAEVERVLGDLHPIGTNP